MTIDEAIEYGRNLERAAIVERMCFMHLEFNGMEYRARSERKIAEWKHHAESCKLMAQSINNKIHHREHYPEIVEQVKNNKPIGKCAQITGIEIKV